jgi:hypothetical protein
MGYRVKPGNDEGEAIPTIGSRNDERGRNGEGRWNGEGGRND